MPNDRTVSDSEEKDAQTGAHAMNYLVELFLDENNYVSRTRIYHVQSDQEAAWDNWDQDKLLAFFKRRPELRLTTLIQPVKFAQQPETEEVHTEGIKAEPIVVTASSSATIVANGTKADTAKSLIGKPHLRKLEIIPAQSRFPSRSFDHNQAFNVRLYLDLAEMRSCGQESFDYTVAVMAKSLDGERRQEFRKDQGTITVSNNSTLNLKWPTLPPGIYRISAALTLSPKDTNVALQDELIASLEGGLFEVH